MQTPKLNDFPIAVLISGRGSNFISLHHSIMSGQTQGRIACVISSSPQAKGLQYARAHDIPAIAVAPESMKSEESFANALLSHLHSYHVKLVVLAGFLKKIPRPVVAAYENRMINIHPALLPAFGGKGMYGRHVHTAVLNYGCKVTGVTVHIVTHDYDAGPPVLQECVPVLDGDSPESLAERVLKIEHKLLPRAVDLFARGCIHIDGRRVKIKEI